LRSGEPEGASGWNLAWLGDRRSPFLMKIFGVVYRLLTCADRCRRFRDRGFVWRRLSWERDLPRHADGPEVPEGKGAGYQLGLGSVSVGRRGNLRMREKVAVGDSQHSLRVSDGGCDA